MIEIAILSKDNRFSIWVDNLDDAERLVKNSTPAILKLFESAFVETQFC